MASSVAGAVGTACVFALVAAGSTPVGAGVTCRAPGTTYRMDVGAPAQRAALSADGSVVAFTSAARHLVRRDTNGVADVFLRDLATGRTVRVSVTSTGRQANGASFYPSLSSDGRIVAFRSQATNLVPGDRNGVEDVFVHDRVTGRTERVSVSSTGREANAASVSAVMSADGNVVAFSSRASNLVPRDRNGVTDVFVRDRRRSRTARISVGPRGEADARSEGSSISAHGRVVAFRSFATNLVPGDTNGLADDFVRDRVRGVTERVNVSSSGAQADAETFRPMVSSDGRRVGFRSRAGDLVDGDTNYALDVFVRDRVASRTTRISVAWDGDEADPVGLPWMATQTSFMSRPFLSATGRFAAFTSRAGNLVPGDANGVRDVFVHDLGTHRTVRVSVAANGAEAAGASFVSGLSADGRVVLFQSDAANLARGDGNGRRDVFVRVRAVAVPCP